ncbi:SbcC/MukB-like Walker B domain-containing protein, partial [Paenibacillus sacheonensis]
AAWSAAAAEAAEGEPRLARRLDQLSDAERLEGEAAALAAGIADVAQRAGSAAERQRSFGEQAAKSQEMLGRATAKQTALRAELKTVELTTADREKRGSLTKRLQQFSGLAAQTEAARKERDAGEALREQAWRTMEAAKAEHGQAVAALSGQAERLLPMQGLLAHIGSKLRAMQASLPGWMERVRQGLREQQRLQLAAQLAAELKDGEPCPVCGSSERHISHAAPSAANETADALLQAWETLSGRCQQLQLELSPLQAKAESAVERVLESLQAAGRGEESAGVADLQSFRLPEAAAAAEAAIPSGIASRLEAPDPADSVLHPSEVLEHGKQMLAALRELTDLNGQQLAAADKAAAAARARCSETARRLEQSTASLSTQQALAGRAQAQFAQCQADLDHERAVWVTMFGPELQPAAAEETLQELDRREAAADELRIRLDKSVAYIEETTLAQQESSRLAQEAQLEAVQLTATLTAQRQQLAEKEQQVNAVTGGQPSAKLIQDAERELAALRDRNTQLARSHEAAQQALHQAAEQRTGASEAERAAAERNREAAGEWEAALARSPFAGADEISALEPLLQQQTAMADIIARHREQEQQFAAQIRLLRDQLGGRTLADGEWEHSAAEVERLKTENDQHLQLAAKADRDLESLRGKQERWNALEAKRLGMERLTGRLKSLQTVFRGNAFVEYVAEEQLVQVCRAASERLGFLTKRRYALEVDSAGGFVIRDDAGGGIRRPVSTLSGGETFLASLALALALSSQIQLRGKYPLQFFFLDEGFGTLDPELLDTVITALEKLHHETLAVGVISHVPELRARLPRRLIVTPSEPFGKGSSVELETM